MTRRTRGNRLGRLSAIPALVLLLMLGLALQPGTAMGATVYVATTGNDTTGAGTQLSPWRSITKGVTAASAYDTITVSAGTYSVTTTAELFPIRMKDGQRLIGAGDTNTTIRSNGTTCAVSAYELWGTPRIDGFLITGGGGSGNGGGVLVYDTNAEIANCTISGNSVSGDGGGIYFWFSDSQVLTTTISGNAAYDGGGIWAGEASDLLVLSSNIDHNAASHSGGGIYSDHNYGIIGLVSIHDNTAAADGGAIASEDSAHQILDTTIYGNSAARGGAIYGKFATLVAANDTIYGNAAPQGGGLHLTWTPSTIFNCIIWGNGDDLAGDRGAPSATYSDIQDGDPGNGNFSQDPKFVNEAGDDFHLALDSPCIDAGAAYAQGPTVLAVVFPPPIDKDWVSRPLDGDGDGYARFDVGAYEFKPNCWLVLSASPTEVAYGGKTVLSTTLDSTTGPLAAHNDVTLWRRSVSTTAYTKEATAAYNAAAHTYSVTTALTANTIFQMRHSRDTTYGGASSETVTVNCRASLSKPTMSDYTLYLGQTFNIYSYLKPKHTGYGAQFIFYRKTAAGAWKYATKKTTLASNYSTYSRCLVRTRLFTRGSWRVKAVHTDADHAQTDSSYRTFTVR